METQPISPEESNQPSGLLSGLNLATDLVGGTSIPAPIKRNALKAFDRLCTAAIEIPAAYLEGIAAEKRAETESRVKLIEKTGNQIAEQMLVDPAYAKAAVRKFGHRVIREQINLDKIVEKAAQDIKDTPAEFGNQDDKNIDDDWLNAFEKEAAQKSTDDMQRMFARILAGEIKRPSSFSIKALKLLAELDQTTATLFRQFCSACITLGHPRSDVILDARVPSLGGNAGSNSLSEHGLNYAALNILQEHGLIIADYNSWTDYQHAVIHRTEGNLHVTLSFLFQKKRWALLPLAERKATDSLKIHGVALTQAGQQLSSIVDIHENDKFREALKNYFASQNLGLMEVPFHKWRNPANPV